MAQGDIEHKELPDDLLHEPKGASTAVAGTVYIANGAGAGSFQKLPTTSLDITKETIDSLTPAVIDSTASLNGSSLSQTAAGVLTDIAAYQGIPLEITNKINQNAAELYRLYQNQLTINTKLSAAIAALETKLNSVIAALKGLGLAQ